MTVPSALTAPRFPATVQPPLATPTVKRLDHFFSPSTSTQ
ncbi:hypothetical protein FTUN_8679 [Frigoriglobus tundricola]|uniref:Uncharacterized protein n=1 Tax=Frigoriglobus tundricola TaxID=2774151 RepID=A0A6M5Z6P1_9BACT|nr:hypothetical protein FTUN_8679 [Frigoriglobus tundricola]